MALTRKTQATVPPGELVRLRDTLAPYGSTLWESPEGEGVLVLRVPGNEPDLVNDMEEAAEYVGPELADAKSLVLLGNTGSTVVPTEILQPIVLQRRKRDIEFAKAVRPTMKAGSHRIMPAPGDARRLPRLVVRIGRNLVAATEDGDWDELAYALGTGLSDPDAMSLEGALLGVRFVHVVADKDEVRLDADLVIRDLDQRWGNEQERRRLAAEAAAKLAPKAEPAPPETPARSATRAPATALASANDPLAAFDAHMAGRADLNRHERAKMAIRREDSPNPVRRMGPSTVNWEAPTETSGVPFDLDAELATFHANRPRSASPARPVEVDARHRNVQYEVDTLLGIPHEAPAAPAVRPAAPRSATSAPATASSTSSASEQRARIDEIIGGVTPRAARPAPVTATRSSATSAPALAPPAPKPEGPGVAELRSKLEINGYEVIPAKIDGVALAAERMKHPMRVLAFAPAKLDLATAVKVLALVKSMDADVGLVVCTEADQDAKERFIATRGRWVAPDAVGQLVLA